MNLLFSRVFACAGVARAGLLGLLLAAGPAALAQSRPVADPALPLAPPGVQDYRRYSPADQQEVAWAARERPARPAAGPRAKSARRQLRPGAVVFGWHPYWLGGAYATYDFGLLTHLAYYGYQANDLGDLLLPALAHQRPDSLIAHARRLNPACRVLLSIAYPTAESQTSLLQDSRLAAQRRLIDAIAEQVHQTRAHGVNLDFCAPDPQPSQLLAARQQRLDQQQDSLRARQQRLSAGARALSRQQADLAPEPDSLLLLATQKEDLTDEAQQLGQQQQALTQRIALHRQQVPKAPEPTWLGRVRGWLGLDAAAQAALAKARADYARDEQRLTELQMKLNAQVARNRQRQRLNDQLTRAYAARMAANQPALADNRAQQAKNREAQALTRDQARRARQTQQALLRRAGTYPVPPGLTPLSDHSRELQEFVARLAVRLWAQDTAAVITLSVPAVDGTGTYQRLRAVQHLVRLFVVKAFDYTVYNQRLPGPLAPLKPGEAWGPHSVSTSVAYYLKQGQVPAAQLAVGFPHLGKVWQADSLDGQEVFDQRPAAYWTLGQLRPHLAQDETKLDVASLSHMGLLAAPVVGQLPAQVWWEDTASLAPKYDWVLAQHLAGVGSWSPGYEADSPGLWQLLRSRFTVPVPALAAAKAPLTLYGLRHVLVLGAVVLIGFLLVGLLVALYRRADALLPNPPLLGVLSLLIGLCSLCVAGYLFWFGRLIPSRPALLVLAGLALVLGAVLYRRYWRRQLLP